MHPLQHNINLGCGDRYAPDWWNVDVATMPFRVDEVVDLRGDLPWPDNSIVRAYAGHVLEHLYPSEAQALCYRLRQKMIHGGQFMVVGPECDLGDELLKNGPDEFGATIESLTLGGHRWPGDEHRWRSTITETAYILACAGWKTQQVMHMNDVVAEGWPVADPRPKWQFALKAVNVEQL